MADPQRPDHDQRGPDPSEGRREPPGYDPKKQNYTGISANAHGGPEAVRSARDFAEMIVDTIREGLLVLDFDLCVQAANESFYRMFGVRPEDTVGRRVYALGSGQWDLPELRELLEDILPHDKVFDGYEVEHEFEGIGKRCMVLNARRLDDHQLILLAIEDATERRRTERALVASEERFRLLAENATEYAILAMDPANHVVMWSPSAERILGWREAEALGQTGAIIFTEEDRAVGAPEEELAWALAEGSVIDERWHVRRDGSRFWASGTMVALRDEGAVRGFVKILRDNTEQKKAEEALRASEARFRLLAEAVPDIVFATTPDGIVDYVSPRREEITGYGPETALGTRMWPDLIHPDDRARAEAQRDDAYAEGRPFEAQYRLHTKGRGTENAGYCWFIARARPLREDAGRITRWLGTLTDVNALVQAEEAVRRLNETLEEKVREQTQHIRELSRALALAEQEERQRIAQILHDDLQQILFAADIALAAGDTSRSRALLNEAMTTARTLAHGLSPPLLEGENVADLLGWVAERARERYGLEVEVELRGAIPVPEPALRVLLYQILRELLFNVVKHAGTNRARLVVERADGHVHLTVADEGAGFDPAAVTPPGASGLGLPSVRERVELIGGQLEVESAPRRGTRVTITVPVESARPPREG